MSTNTFARNVASDKMKRLGFTVIQNGRDFIVRGKRINVRGCNINNGMAQKTGPGWNRLDPKKFDYCVCVAFDKDLDTVRYFIFSRKEVEEFPNVVWKNTPKLKNIMLKQEDEKLDSLIKSSEDAWGKIK
ncbi:MAG: hypothetical protein UY50_C0009G0042 [Parcubacteria group bacterium GW2011_GWA2_49_9]|nr:MAG: hypothetical protein UY50_C0009G0042 [Parcubacteria group bacterium GW2011_GWA2_49_9]